MMTTDDFRIRSQGRLGYRHLLAFGAGLALAVALYPAGARAAAVFSAVIVDAVTGKGARVDEAGRLQVSGAITSVPGTPSTPFAVTAGSVEAGAPAVVQVPAGKRLVVETLSLQVEVEPGKQFPAFITYVSGGKEVLLFVPLSFSFADVGADVDTWVATQAVRLYPDPGTSISLQISTPLSNSLTNQFLTVSGYLQ
jgi:hypothetical protein